MNSVRVAFSGHARPEDLGEVSLVGEALSKAFGLLKAAGFQRGDLTTGLADGADRLALDAWAKAGLGPVHVVYPFLDETPDPALGPQISSLTWLDGERAIAEGRNPHLLQARWLIEDTDLLMVVWTGEAGRGAGGTADSVRLALERGVPVLWVQPGEGVQLRLINPDALEADFGFLEFLEQLQRGLEPLVAPADAKTLATVLSRVGAAVADPAQIPAPRAGWARRTWETLLDHTIWRTYTVLRNGMGGKITVETGVALPEDLAALTGFQLLSEAYAAADIEAGRLASIHRSQQVFQAAVMLLAAAIGSAPAVWPQFKIECVLAELTLALLAFFVWRDSTRSERGRRWGEARRLAEQLRLERAGWAIGVSTRDDRRFAATSEAGLAAWRWRRAAGSPSGRYDPNRVQDWGRWALDSLVTGQLAYHRAEGHRNHLIAHRSHVIESRVFFAFIAVLILFAAAYGWAMLVKWELPHWVGGAVLIASAVTPAFGAASLALDSSLAFSEQGRRNAHMVHHLSALSERLPEGPSLERLQRMARAAIRLQVSQEERWIDDAAHRRIVRA